MGKLSFGTTGIAYEVDKVTLDSSGAPRCPRCHDRVYYNEEKKAIGKSWHKRCFICVTCRRSLDSTNCNEHDGEVYCGSCHRRQFGPRGYGFAGGAAGLSTESTVKQLRPQPGSQVVAVPQNIPATSIDPASLDCCPGCGKRVYFAEEVKALKRSWHKLCFKCKTCRKLLEPGSCSEHEGNIFCRACYSKQFGPKGYGFAGGAGSMLAAEDRYSVEARAGAARSNDGETYTLRTKPRADRVDDRYTSDGRSVNLSQSNAGETYTLETRRRPSAGSVPVVSDRYTAETARGVNGKMERPVGEVQATETRPMPADSRYISQNGKTASNRLTDEHVYTVQQQQPKQSAQSRLFPDERPNSENRLMPGSPERPVAEPYSIQNRTQQKTDSDDRYARYTNGSSVLPTEPIQTHAMPVANSGYIPDDRYNSMPRYTNGSSERRASNESYSIQARAQPSAGLPNDTHYTTDYRRTNGTIDRPTGDSYSPRARPQVAGHGMDSGARRSSETRLMNGAAERPMNESYQTRARPSLDSGLPDRYAPDSRPANASTETYVVHSKSSSGLSADGRSPNPRYMNGSARPDEVYHLHTRAPSGSSPPGAVPNDRYHNGTWMMNGMTERPSGDKYAGQTRVMSNSGPAQFTDDRYSVDSSVSRPNGRYPAGTGPAAPMTAAAVEDRRYSILARATPSAAYRSPAQNSPGKAGPVYV